MDEAKLRYYYNRCDPAEPLDPDDERRVPLNRFGAGNVYIRGADWTARLSRKFLLPERPTCILFTGLRGSGKTTELRALAQALDSHDGGAILPVLLSAEDGVELTAPIDIPEIMFTIIEGLERKVLELEGKASDEALDRSVVGRLWDWLGQTDVSMPRLEMVAGGPKVGIELKTRPTLRQQVRVAVEQRLSTFLQEVRYHIKALEERVKAAQPRYRRVVVILDSLEKLQGTSSNWREVMESAEKLFAGGAPYLQLGVHVLYTVPPALLFRLGGTVEFLPMIKVRDRGGAPFEPGVGAARSLVQHRIDVTDLAAILGDDWGDRLDRIIAWSGGYPRDLVRVLHALLESEQFPVPDAELDRALFQLGDEYRRIVFREEAEWLRRLGEEKQLRILDGNHREAVDFMLQNNVILRYVNSEEWYDLHPALGDLSTHLTKEAIDQDVRP
ncbi:MAG: hypothetical protein KC933_15465 [Myxococcales bacterium]|nr:hypothetical protein [Myxococcales bacterium]